jgi:hypothetical protein
MYASTEIQLEQSVEQESGKTCAVELIELTSDELMTVAGGTTYVLY